MNDSSWSSAVEPGVSKDEGWSDEARTVDDCAGDDEVYHVQGSASGTGRKAGIARHEYEMEA